jgi:uncharacterized protein (DUF433 family)
MAFAVITDPVPLQMNSDGVLHVGGTRVTLDTIIGAFTDGATPEEIIQQYPSLDLADIYAVLGYYLRHRAEVEGYLHRRQQQAQQVRQQNEERFPSIGIRERLLARRRSAEQ